MGAAVDTCSTALLPPFTIKTRFGCSTDQSFVSVDFDLCFVCNLQCNHDLETEGLIMVLVPLLYRNLRFNFYAVFIYCFNPSIL